eukprot:1707212-Amphidinium_carterae.1
MDLALEAACCGLHSVECQCQMGVQTDAVLKPGRILKDATHDTSATRESFQHALRGVGTRISGSSPKH